MDESIDQKVEQIGQMSLQTLLTANQQNIGEQGWEEIARLTELPDRHQMTPGQIERRWLTSVDPSVNTGPWQKEEEKRLSELATLYGEYEWERIATELETGRTACGCLSKWQRSLNVSIVKGAADGWCPEEDADLREPCCLSVAQLQQVCVCRPRSAAAWTEQLAAGASHDCTCSSRHGVQVSKSMQGWRRNGAQCLQRWSKALAPHRKGYWNQTEILQLQYAVRSAA